MASERRWQQRFWRTNVVHGGIVPEASPAILRQAWLHALQQDVTDLAWKPQDPVGFRELVGDIVNGLSVLCKLQGVDFEETVGAYLFSLETRPPPPVPGEIAPTAYDLKKGLL